jgi:hypothetical protein
MSVHLFVGPSNIGKTFAIREWLLPAMLADPIQATAMAPPNGYAAALIHDPPTVKDPKGQYDGALYQDVSEWKRAEKKPRVARFVDPSMRALCETAIERGRLVLVLDELDRLLPSARTPAPEAANLIERGRHYGCLIVGGCRRLKAVHTSVRGNIERAYFGNLADDEDRAYAAECANVSPDLLRGITQQGVFLEWDRASGRVALIRVQNRKRTIIRSL